MNFHDSYFFVALTKTLPPWLTFPTQRCCFNTSTHNRLQQPHSNHTAMICNPSPLHQLLFQSQTLKRVCASWSWLLKEISLNNIPISGARLLTYSKYHCLSLTCPSIPSYVLKTTHWSAHQHQAFSVVNQTDICIVVVLISTSTSRIICWSKKKNQNDAFCNPNFRLHFCQRESISMFRRIWDEYQGASHQPEPFLKNKLVALNPRRWHSRVSQQSTQQSTQPFYYFIKDRRLCDCVSEHREILPKLMHPEVKEKPPAMAIPDNISPIDS